MQGTQIFGFIGLSRMLVPLNYALALNARNSARNLDFLIDELERGARPLIYELLNIGLAQQEYNEAVKTLKTLKFAGRGYFSIVDFKNNEGQVM